MKEKFAVVGPITIPLFIYGAALATTVAEEVANDGHANAALASILIALLICTGTTILGILTSFIDAYFWNSIIVKPVNERRRNKHRVICATEDFVKKCKARK